MNVLFISQNITHEIYYLVNVSCGNNTEVVATKNDITIGSIYPSGIGYNKTGRFTLSAAALGFNDPSITSVELTLTQASTPITSTVTITRDVYSYDVDMNTINSIKITGIVTNANGGAVIPEAIISQTGSPKYGDTISATSKLNGKYTWSGYIPAGRYVLNCSANGYVTQISTITVADAEGQSFTVDFALPKNGCTIWCDNPTKSTELAIRLHNNVSGASAAIIMGSCTAGTAFSYELSYNDYYKKDVSCQIYDARDATVYATITLPSPGSAVSFQV